jgi:hypothetical protein
VSTVAFQGSLDGIGLTPLLQFLAELETTGALRITDGHRTGEIGIADGRVVGVTFGPQRGSAALESIALALPDGDFSFTAGVAALDPNGDVELHRAAA